MGTDREGGRRETYPGCKAAEEGIYWRRNPSRDLLAGRRWEEDVDTDAHQPRGEGIRRRTPRARGSSSRAQQTRTVSPDRLSHGRTETQGLTGRAGKDKVVATDLFHSDEIGNRRIGELGRSGNR